MMFGKFVTTDKWYCSPGEWIPGAEAFHLRTVWCDDNVGRIGTDWDYYPESKTFIFTSQEDAVAFKLKFGL